MSFWKDLTTKKRPFLALAPMEDVTDVVFRQVIEEIATPDVFFTEFTNVEAILHNAPSDPPLNLRGGRKGELLNNPALYRLLLSKTKIPTVAQIWGIDPESFYQASQIVAQMGFDGIDINMGCPDKDVVKGGCGIALIRDKDKVKEIIQATKEGGGLPLSVKTRIGWEKIVTEDWCGFLLEQKLDALTVHGRTGKEKSDGEAHWDEIAKAVSLRDQSKSKTIIIGNGDVINSQDAIHKSQEFGVDGAMIGRGVFSNPWCFSNHISTQEEKINLLKRHLELWQETWGNTKNFSVLKKYFKIYVRDFEGASELRARLMNTVSLSEINNTL